MADMEKGYITSIVEEKVTSKITEVIDKLDKNPAGEQRHGERPGQSSAVRRPIWIAWAIEILSCILAAAVLIAMFGLLFHYNHRPLPLWPHGLSLNTVISILVVVFKAALLRPVAQCVRQLKWRHFLQPRPLVDLVWFDSASRSATDSTLLLLKSRNPLTMIAISIMVLALAIGPFCQQIVKYDSCTYVVPNEYSIIARTNSWNIPSTLGAVYAGLYDPPTDPTSLFVDQCSTGNCNFPEADGITHASAGICYSFTDINDTATMVEGSDQDLTDIEHPTYILPSGLVLNGSRLAGPQTLVVRDVTSNFTENLITFETLMMKYASCSNDSVESCATKLTPYAFRSALYPCVISYHGTVDAAELAERVISSTPMTRSEFGFSLVTNETLQGGKWKPCEGTDSATEDNTVAYPLQGSSNDTSTTTGLKYYSKECVWSMPQPAVNSSVDNLAGFFNGQQYLVSSSGLPATNDGALYLENLAQSGTANEDSINKFLGNLTDSLTAEIRTQSDPAKLTWTKGIVIDNQTCIGIKWRWMSLPAALLALTALLVALVAIKTQSENSPPPWKSSELPLAFHGFSDEDSADSDRYDSPQRMARTAKSSKAVLRQQPVGVWKLVESV